MDGEKLRKWRDKMGFTQPEAAEALGISFRAYQNYEGDVRGIPVPVELACKYLEEHPRVAKQLAKAEA